MLLEKRKIIIIAAVVGVSLIVAAVFGFSAINKNTESETDVYHDPSSGETIITNNNTPQVDPEVLKNSIIYPGFSKLLDRGLSTLEIQSIQATIAEYSLEQEDKFKEVSLVVDSMRYDTSTDDPETSPLTFNIKVNRKDDYYVTVTPKDSVTSVTKLYAADKTTLLIER